MLHALLFLTLRTGLTLNFMGEAPSAQAGIEIRFEAAPLAVEQAGSSDGIAGNPHKNAFNRERSTDKSDYPQSRGEGNSDGRRSQHKKTTGQASGVKGAGLAGGATGETPAMVLAHNPKPPYPLIARKRGQQGTVVLKVVVAADGIPVSVSVQHSSGYSLLDQSALDTVGKWRFSPAVRAGKPVQSERLLPVEFRLE